MLKSMYFNRKLIRKIGRMNEKNINKLKLNTITPLMPQLATIISGFLIPRLILKYFGTNVNGLIQSITQFLSIITFMEAGVGSVIRYNLYKPLYDKNNYELSKIIVSARKFFRRIAFLFLGYTLILMFSYPSINKNEFSHLYTAILIAAMCISYFAQYYFGQVNQLLLTADQRGYIQYITQAITIVANTIACAIMIKMGAGIHIVKLATSIIFLIRPIFLEWYVNRHYRIDFKVTYEGEPIKQKWNGFAQHITAVILESTDIIILTIFTTLANVSIYSAYHMVVYGIKTLMATATNGIEVLIGNIIASNNIKKLESVFSFTEWAIHSIAGFVYGCTAILIVPFIMVYTKGVYDINYNVPIFALLITLANLSHTLRLPYSIIVLSSGHYRETQNSYIITSAINLVISVIFVKRFGLIGVAIGTLVSMVYQIIWLAWYSYKKILKRNLWYLIKQLFVDVVSFCTMYFIGSTLEIDQSSYYAWIISAIKITVICSIVLLFINFAVYSTNMKKIYYIWTKKHSREKTR